MKYREYETYDFLKDEFFVRWAKNDDPQLSDFWEKWLVEHPGRREIVLEAKRLIRAFEYEETVNLTDEDYVKMYEAILKGEKQIKKEKRTYRLSLYRIAAVIALFLISYVVVIQFSNNVPTKPDRIITRTTKAGEKLTFQLPDGSIIKLNSATQLSFSKSFDGPVREVFLSGEAFFEVAEDAARPFVVNVDHVLIRALGTSFNIKSYQETRHHAISLVTGSVEVNVPGSLYDPVVLSPGQQALVAEDHSELSIADIDISSILGWRDGVITFNESDFDQVISDLERWYGVRISVSGQPAARDNFSGSFKNEELNEILEVLAYSSGFSYSIRGKDVTIKFKKDDKDI
ncbi:MAG: DUF4974 domain-containing protein [Cyclobacteriaceae bacterium]|nr:DUF4974 domain-containing protein [Cyclobacteriaceae bacterium HetDA_MAG_MS6]